MDAAEIEKLGRLEDRHWWYAERRWLLRRMLRTRPPAGWALDLGAAAGGNPRVLRSAGWQCLAIEYAEVGAQLAHGRGLSVVRGDATALPLRDASLGLVVAFDVLEHIDDDDTALAEIYRALQPGGHLLVAVPVDMRLWSEHDVAVGHVRRYTRDTIADLVSRGGFVDVELKSWNVLLRPVVAMRRKTSSGSDLDEPHAVVNTVLRTAVMVERALPVAKMPSVSVLLTARKPG
ncbi:MAG TPA: class I SAM-dependent methyltransferase [Mycobacteriales bacterium]|nr:class I SAM-dependent methyltransferase [Mycobacteriales bacterium]